MHPESGCIHNFRHDEKCTLHPGDDVCNKRWRHNVIIKATVKLAVACGQTLLLHIFLRMNVNHTKWE